MRWGSAATSSPTGGRIRRHAPSTCGHRAIGPTSFCPTSSRPRSYATSATSVARSGRARATDSTSGSTATHRNSANPSASRSGCRIRASTKRAFNSPRADRRIPARVGLTVPLTSLRLEPAEIIRVALVHVFETQEIVIEVSVQLSPLRPLADQPLDLDQAGARLGARDPVEAVTKFGRQRGNRVLRVEIQPIVFRAREVEQRPQPPDA